MVDPEKNTWSMQKNSMVELEKQYMVDPEKIQ